jgi:hypothetical protein
VTRAEQWRVEAWANANPELRAHLGALARENERLRRIEEAAREYVRLREDASTLAAVGAFTGEDEIRLDGAYPALRATAVVPDPSEGEGGEAVDYVAGRGYRCPRCKTPTDGPRKVENCPYCSSGSPAPDPTSASVEEKCPNCGGDATDNWFDRSLCPCANVMHTRCASCGAALDSCVMEREEDWLPPDQVKQVRKALFQADKWTVRCHVRETTPCPGCEIKKAIRAALALLPTPGGEG